MPPITATRRSRAESAPYDIPPPSPPDGKSFSKIELDIAALLAGSTSTKQQHGQDSGMATSWSLFNMDPMILEQYRNMMFGAAQHFGYVTGGGALPMFAMYGPSSAIQAMSPQLSETVKVTDSNQLSINQYYGFSADLIKRPWTETEDDLMTDLVAKHGTRSWSLIASYFDGRIGKQCRERWVNHLCPGISKAPWTVEEDRIIYEYHSTYGNKWAEIVKKLPGRTENALKNHWNCSVRRERRKLLKLHASKDSFVSDDECFFRQRLKNQDTSSTEDDNSESVAPATSVSSDELSSQNIALSP